MQLVVGDKLSSFARAVGALTRSEAVQALFSKAVPASLAIGQGISDEDIRFLTALSEACGKQVIPLSEDRRRADRSITHKHNPENGLISLPLQIADHILEADILIDDKNEIMSDHLTGCHIQGMVLIEAIRQMFVAAVELRKASNPSISNPYVVIHRIDVTFESFAFPVATTIRHTTLTADDDPKGRSSFKAIVEIEQNGSRCVAANVEYSALEASMLTPKEVLKARRCADTFLRSKGRTESHLSDRRANGHGELPVPADVA